MSDLRRLDFDDLWLLQLLLEGKTLVAIANHLKISQPAVSQRLRKVESIFSTPILMQKGRRLHLTDEGTAVAEKARAALRILADAPRSQRPAVINLGTRPEVGVSWLSTALFRLRKTHPDLCFHVQIASGSEIMQRLSSGQLDAVLTSTPIPMRDHRSIELVREEYVMVAKKGTLDPSSTWKDLKQHILIEYDRSLPFLRYLSPADRSRAQFKDVWFLGSTVLMARAVEAGHGIGIVPGIWSRMP
ncbi:MAG: LysR family transcriptional regulator [Pseudobdellovibrionaceae bacterium]|nr:LysR family transcriptional regulator [Pseudobdellovibrionaceae bacterium]